MPPQQQRGATHSPYDHQQSNNNAQRQSNWPARNPPSWRSPSPLSANNNKYVRSKQRHDYISPTQTATTVHPKHCWFAHLLRARALAPLRLVESPVADVVIQGHDPVQRRPEHSEGEKAAVIGLVLRSHHAQHLPGLYEAGAPQHRAVQYSSSAAHRRVMPRMSAAGQTI